MSRFKTLNISDLGKTITGKTPLSESPKDFGNEIPFITPPDFFGQKYISRPERFLSHEGGRKLSGKLLSPSSIMVTCIGSVGKIAMTKVSSITNQQINAIIVSDVYSPDYVFYILRNSYKLFRNAAGGSTVLPLLNKTDFDLLKVKIHKNKEDQEKIAAVLTALDAKIECNNSINAELEAIAKTLYDYWFVQFNFPDHNGQSYKSSGGKMVYNPTLKRQIPAGWHQSTIGETFKTYLGGTPSREKDEYWTPGEVNWLSSAENPGTFVVDPDERISYLGLQNSPAKLLPQGTVILSIVRHLRASILGIEAATNQSVVGIVETSTFKHCFIYPYLVREIPRLMALRTGAQQPHINKGVLDESLLVVPDESTIKTYTSLAIPLFLQMKNYHQQNRELTQLRDWLLPMLMNGQITVL